MVATLELYLEKHGIHCQKGMIKQHKTDVVAAHIARSLVGANALGEGDKTAKTDREYEDVDDDDVVLEETGDFIEEEEEVSDGEDDCTTFLCDHRGNETADDSDNSENGYHESEDNNCNDDTVDISDVLCTIRSGRTCRTWKGRSLYY